MSSRALARVLAGNVYLIDLQEASEKLRCVFSLRRAPLPGRDPESS